MASILKKTAFSFIYTMALPSLMSLSTQAQPIQFEPVSEKSFIAVATDRSGLFGFLGHAHGILAKKWKADICLDRDHIENSSVRIEVPVQSLEIDSREARVKVGLDPEGPGPEDRKKIRETMLGPEYLNMKKYPEIIFESKSAEYKIRDRVDLTGQLFIRGKARLVSVILNQGSDDKESVTFTGDFKIKQTDFGMKPQSVAGVVNVADEILIRFWITAQLSQSSCKP